MTPIAIDTYSCLYMNRVSIFHNVELWMYSFTLCVMLGESVGTMFE